MSSITQFLSTPIGQTITVVSFTRLFFTNGEGPHLGTPILNLINPLTEVLGNQLKDELPKNVGGMVDGVIQDSSVILLSSAIAYGVQILTGFLPTLSSANDIFFETAIKTSLFVGTVFFVKAALAQFLRKRFPSEMNPALQAKWIATVHLCPLALTSLAAYYYDDSINLGQAGGITLGTFGVMKVLGWAFRKSCELETVKSLINSLS